MHNFEVLMDEYYSTNTIGDLTPDDEVHATYVAQAIAEEKAYGKERYEMMNRTSEESLWKRTSFPNPDGRPQLEKIVPLPDGSNGLGAIEGVHYNKRGPIKEIARGNDFTIVLPDGSEQKGYYAIVELADITASMKFDSLEPHPDYPPGIADTDFPRDEFGDPNQGELFSRSMPVMGTLEEKDIPPKATTSEGSHERTLSIHRELVQRGEIHTPERIAELRREYPEEQTPKRTGLRRRKFRLRGSSRNRSRGQPTKKAHAA